MARALLGKDFEPISARNMTELADGMVSKLLENGRMATQNDNSELRFQLRHAMIPVPAVADAVSDFYKGKIVNLIISTGAGASYDFYGRTVVRHMSNHMTGNPAFTAQNMPGASGFRAGNHLYNVAPKDGTVIGSFNSAIAFYQAMNQPGIQFKAENFSWIGSIPQDTAVVAVWHTTGVKSVVEL